MSAYRRYLELTKPKVTSLNLFVGVACFVLASLPSINWPALAAFFSIGYMTVGGCGALNCFLDRDIDALMERTSRRAIPTGAITPRNALIFGVTVLSAGSVTTYIAFGIVTLAMVLLGGIFYLFVYTIWLKRSTRWNVLIGAIAGSFAALAGWTATGASISLMPILVGALDFLWTPGHLWSLAIRRTREYQEALVPMLPVKVGLRRASQIVFGFNSATFVFSFLFPLLGLTGVMFTVIVFVSGVRLLRTSYLLLNHPSEEYGLKTFKASMPYLACVMTGLIIDKLISVRLW